MTTPPTGRWSICNSFDDPRIVLHQKTDEPRGTPISRNRGIKLARGSIIALQDGDDISLPTRIEKQVALIHQHGPNTITGVFVEKVIGGEPFRMKLPVDHEGIVEGFKRVYRRDGSIVAGVMCARTEIFREFRYNPHLKFMEDWDLLLRLYESGRFRFCNVPEFLYRYLIHSSGTKYQKGWVDWNMVVRNNQERRKMNQPEFTNPAEMYRSLRSQPVRLTKTIILRNLIDLKRRISFEFRKT